MQNYKDVVKNRYNREIDDPENNIYSVLSDIGSGGWILQISILRMFVNAVRKRSNKPVKDLTFLDCGCGKGLMSRTLCEITETPYNIYGFEFSQTRLDKCIEMNKNINYSFGDITEKIQICTPKGGEKLLFDGIIAADVFMHLRNKKEVSAALASIKESLSPKGLFMWYETNANTHYSDDDLDGRGFSINEMISHAKETGMVPIEIKKINPKFPRVGSIYYRLGKLPVWLFLLLQKMPSLDWSNNIILFANETIKEGK